MHALITDALSGDMSRVALDCDDALRGVIDSYLHTIAVRAQEMSTAMFVTQENVHDAIQDLKYNYYGNVADCLATKDMNSAPLMVSRNGQCPTLSDIRAFLST